MLPIRLVVRLINLTLDWVFIRVGLLRKDSGFHLERTGESFAGRLSDSKVVWYSKNQNVESILLFSLSIFLSTFWDVDQDAISDDPTRGLAARLKVDGAFR